MISLVNFIFNRLHKPASEPAKEATAEAKGSGESCADEIAAMKPLWNTLRNHPDIFNNSERYIKKRSALLAPFTMKPMFALAAAAMLVLAIGVGYWNQPDAWHLADAIEISEAKDAGVRGMSDPNFATGLQALKAGDFEKAKGEFEIVCLKDLENYQAYYYLGICFLQQADNGILWMRRVDEARLNAGIKSLTRAIALSEGKDPAYQAQAHFGLAKAYLLKKDRAHARQELQKIESLDEANKEIAETKRAARVLKTQLQ